MGNDWLVNALASCVLTPEVEDYLLARGVKDTTILAEGMKTWTPLAEPSPDPKFRQLFRDRGERLTGMMICPVRSPRGLLLGFEARSIYQKKILDYRLPASEWTPFFIGTRKAMPAIWAGGDVWLVEGLFDLAPLEWLVPPQDAVLATVRAHLTPQQLEFLRRFCNGFVHVVYDMDATGQKATHGWKDPETGKHRPGVIQLLERVVDPVTEQCVMCHKTVSKKHLGPCPHCRWAGLHCLSVKYSGGKDPGVIWDKGGLTALRAAFQV